MVKLTPEKSRLVLAAALGWADPRLPNAVARAKKASFGALFLCLMQLFYLFALVLAMGTFTPLVPLDRLNPSVVVLRVGFTSDARVHKYAILMCASALSEKNPLRHSQKLDGVGIATDS